MGVFSWMKSSVPFVVMVMAVTALATNMIVSKMAMSNGTSFFILSVYSNALATLILFPCAFIFHRSKLLPLTFPILCRIFLLALFGCLADIGSYAGILNSSPTLATELLNLVPGFTYILAIIFRFFLLLNAAKFQIHMNEILDGRVEFEKISDIAKLLGTLVSIAGATVVTIYNGPAIMNKPTMLSSSEFLSSSQENWILGGILLATAAFSTAAWSIVQTSILKLYPAETIIVAIYCLFVTTQSTVVAVIAEKDLTAWKLQAEMGLFAVLYAGIINITFRLYMMSWCLSRTGPLFVSLFNPLTIVISVVISVLFFNETLYFGSVAGAAILVVGFYAVIWGKAKEGKMEVETQVSNGESTSHEVPLLQDAVQEA